MINLVIVDVQNDFMDDGALPVKGGLKAASVIENYIEDHYDEIGIVITSQDWHPKDHCSFIEQGGTFPPHCVKFTDGANYSFDLTLLRGLISFEVSKGTDKNEEQFSVFTNCFDASNNYIVLEDPSDNAEHINLSKNDEYVVCGVAGDICVLETLKDMIKYIPVENITVLWNGTASLDGGTKLEQFCADNEIKIDYYGKEYEEISK